MKCEEEKEETEEKKVNAEKVEKKSKKNIRVGNEWIREVKSNIKVRVEW